MDESCQKRKLLMISTILCAGVSTILLTLSISTDHWLQTSERYNGEISDLNIYSLYNQTDVYTLSNLGLWRVCSQFTDVGDKAYTNVECYSNMAASVNEDDGQSGHTVLKTIIGSLRTMMVFPLSSIFMEVLGDILCLLAYCVGRKRHLMFITGCLFVTSGLSLLVASVLFIGAVTGEANHVTQSSNLQRPSFTYQYQSSFIMMSIAFCLDEISGVLSVYLFIIRHKESVKRKHARISAHKSRSERIRNFFRRQSRNRSGSSAYGIEELSFPMSPAFPIVRDTTQLTMLCGAESHTNMKGISYKSEKTTLASKETTPTALNESNILEEETTPTALSESNILEGEPTPTILTESNILEGETTPTVLSESNILGETIAPPLQFQTANPNRSSYSKFTEISLPELTSSNLPTRGRSYCKTTTV